MFVLVLPLRPPASFVDICASGDISPLVGVEALVDVVVAERLCRWCLGSL